MRAILLAAGIATIAALALETTAPPAAAQAAGLTFEQVQRKYRTMSPVFINKCDRNGDEIFTNAELQCVAGIYHAMYIDK